MLRQIFVKQLIKTNHIVNTLFNLIAVNDYLAVPRNVM